MKTHSSSPGRGAADLQGAASRHVGRFNHDEDAADYDEDVQQEADPIRSGYQKLLRWVAAQVRDVSDGPILELGSGTGNLTVRLPTAVDLVCVDISEEMTRRLRAKLTGDRAVRIEIADVLAFVRRAPARAFAAVVSTYTLHHLEEDEKADFLVELERILQPGGLFVVGDLMFENADARSRRVSDERADGNHELADTIEDEFFWEIDRAVEKLVHVGFEVAPPVAFSNLSWGLAARLSGLRR